MKFEQPFCNTVTRYPCWTFDYQAEDKNIIRMVHASQSQLHAVEAKILPDEYTLQYRTLGSLPRTTSDWAESSWAVEDRGDATGERFNVAFGLSNAPPVLLSYPVSGAGEWEESPLVELEELPPSAKRWDFEAD